MTDFIERLRDGLVAEAENAPLLADLTGRVLERHRRRRARRRLLVASASLVATAFGIAAALRSDGAQSNRGVLTTGTPPTSSDTDAQIRPTVPETVTSLAPTTDAHAASGPVMPALVGLDYREALRIVRALGSQEAPVRLALDVGRGAPTGKVTRTTPAVGDRTDPYASIVLYVAADRVDLGFAPDDGLSPRSTGDAKELVGSNIWFPPVGLVAGVADVPAPECSPPNAPIAGRAVRFINGELVGCMFNAFVWIDRLPQLSVPIGTMPDLIGLTYDEARNILAKLGLDKAGVAAGGGAPLQPGGTYPDPTARVVQTTPSTGQQLMPLQVVRLQIAAQ